ncbi:MAG: asparagine synthase (glutamine-hydrolyzing) [Candidatus Rokubacteria bacterium]|nr:asparagine synthase (glutamine-hydrolyzing) [Candidatus Rokubacteria bacterium]
MSAILGLVHADGRPVDPPVLERMLAATRRGPDRERRWIDGPVALGHRLLATTRDALHEPAPVSDASGRRLVWDGRLDNRAGLVAALEADGDSLQEASEARLVLAAHRRWGAACAERLLGDFAFALWDPGARRLVCGRDRMGIRPFHYVWDGRTFTFASDVTSLLPALARAPEPDDEMLVAFLLREFREGDDGRTFFQGIHRLPPGHVLTLEGGRLTVERYWAIDPAREIRYATEQDYVDHFRGLFMEAVACRLRSDWPVGVSLSGGLDSAALVGAAERVYSERGEGSPPVDTFTLYADQPESDEREHARAVAGASGLKLHEIHVSDGDPLDRLDDDLREAEGPIVGAIPPANDALCGAVRSAGCRVLLSGEGGDQLLDEVGYFADLLRTLQPLRFLREARAFARWYGGGFSEFGRDAAVMLLPAVAKYWGKRLLRRAPPPWVRKAVAREIGLAARLRQPRHSLRFPSHCESDTYLSIASPYYLLKLEVEERLAARFGIEMRYPFLDSRLVEFVLAVPWERRTRDGERKRLLRTAMRGLVPEAVLERRGKGDWTLLMDRSVRTVCRREPPAPVENRSGLLDRYVDLARARRMVGAYLGGAGDLRWEVWFLVTVDRWLATFTKRGSP